MPRKELHELFHAGESPYFGMYTAGFSGYELSEVLSYCSQLGLPLREKDVKQWESGNFNRAMREMQYQGTLGGLNPKGAGVRKIQPPEEIPDLLSLPELPQGWTGTDRRFFPCTSDNKPMRKWGWSKDFQPQLLPYQDARVLSPCEWVGQNMLYQPFIVFDIDGAGHGDKDEAVIQFGNLFRDKTMTMEDPAKPGSFHLYFRTNRLVPIKHFPWAKLDLMGNAMNAAVYLKNKKSNGLPMAELTPDVWNAMKIYQSKRKEQSYVS